MDEVLTEIRKSDKKGQAKLDRLLEQAGILRDGGLDYSCGVFDGGELLATGSCRGNTLRCLAVDRAHRGEGLLNQIVSHLIEVQAERGIFHLFLYTKHESAKFFQDLGFSPIAKVEGVVFLENRAGGFQKYCAQLKKTADPEKKPAAAIVMNANPFTLGHRYLVERASAQNAAVHLFLLSEEAGPIPFSVRKRLVREGVLGLGNVILHDTGPYMISSATFPSYFLKSEDRVVTAHAKLDIALFQSIGAALGVSARYVGDEPFSHTTALYNEVMARELPKAGIACRVVPRLELDGQAVSASRVRQAIHDGDLDSVRHLLPESTYAFFASEEAEPVRNAIRAERDVIHH